MEGKEEANVSFKEEIEQLRRRVAELEQAESEREQAEGAFKSPLVQMAEMISHLFALRNPYIARHHRQTAKLALAVGRKMKLDKNKFFGLYLGSLLHDIGKMAIPEGILRKPGRLSAEEWGLIRTHPQYGYDVLQAANLPWPVAEMALQHHERLDGSGYPDGLKGDELSKEVHILIVSNVVDAMSMRHPYRPACSQPEIREELADGRGTKYHSEVVNLLLAMMEDGELEIKEASGC